MEIGKILCDVCQGRWNSCCDVNAGMEPLFISCDEGNTVVDGILHLSEPEQPVIEVEGVLAWHHEHGWVLKLDSAEGA